MKNNGTAGWISCLVILAILSLIMFVVFKFFWWLIFVIPLLSVIRGWIWKRRIKKAQKQAEEFMRENMNSKQQNYCEAEFEILDDDNEE